jgi:hypothetical protein
MDSDTTHFNSGDFAARLEQQLAEAARAAHARPRSAESPLGQGTGAPFGIRADAQTAMHSTVPRAARMPRGLLSEHDSHDKRRMHLPPKVGGIACAAIAVLSLGFGAYKIKTHNADRIAQSVTNEAVFFSEAKEKGATCLGRLVLLNQGTEIRKTPEEIGSIFGGSNTVQTVNEDTEVRVINPLVRRDGTHRTWLGFTLGSSPTARTPAALADATVWAKDDEHVARYVGPAPVPPPETAGCTLGKQGHFEQPEGAAAMGVEEPVGTLRRDSDIFYRLKLMQVAR